MMLSSVKSVLIPLALQIALHASTSTAALVVDWSSYPSGSVSCLNAAQASANCPSNDVPSFNGCVCKNGNGFLQSAATCLGKSDSGDVAGVFNQLSTNCAGTNIPININLAQWNSWASPATTIITTPAPGTTAPATVVVTQQPTTQVITAGSSATVVSTVTLQSAGGTAVVSVITLTPGQTTKIPNVITAAAGSAPTTTAGSSSSSSGSKLGVGAIAGIAVGGAVVIAIIGLIAVLLMRRGGRNNQPSTAAPAFAAAAVPPAAPMSDAGMRPSPGMAQAEPYKDRPVSSIPSTAASPDPTKRGSAFDTPQSAYAVPSPQMQQYAQSPQGYQQYPQGQYPQGQYPQYPPGQYPQETPMQGYAQGQYPPGQYPPQGAPYGAQPPQPYVAHPGQQFSELHSESAQGSQRVELPGGPQ